MSYHPTKAKRATRQGTANRGLANNAEQDRRIAALVERVGSKEYSEVRVGFEVAVEEDPTKARHIA